MLSCFFWQSHSLSFAFGVVMLLCWPISYLMGRRSLSGLQLTWKLPAQVCAHEKCHLEIVLQSPKPTAILKITIDKTCKAQHFTLSKVGSQGTALFWPLTFDKRGWNNLPRVTVQCQQPFGLLCMTRELSDSETILLYPQMGHFSHSFSQKFESHFDEGQSNSPFGNDDFSHLRAYRQGDSFKQVNWKATARSNQLWISQKQALTSKTLFIHIDLQVSPVKRQLFEYQLSFAATLICELKPKGWNVCLIGRFAPEGVSGNQDRLLGTLAGLKTKSSERPLTLKSKQRPCLMISVREKNELEGKGGVLRVSDIDKGFSL